MNPTLALAMVVGIAFSTPLCAQVVKCSNAAGEITYSSTPCASLGLRDAGPIDDRVTVVHQPPLPPAPPRARAAPQPAVAAAPEAAPAPPPVPERRCFRIKTPNGLATRCNDKPPPD